jgi:hypothetical protein
MAGYLGCPASESMVFTCEMTSTPKYPAIFPGRFREGLKKRVSFGHLHLLRRYRKTIGPGVTTNAFIQV